MRTETQRTVGIAILVVLLIAAMVAVRGALPGYTPPQPPGARGGTAMAVAVIVLLALSIVILLVGLVTAVRRRGTTRPVPSAPPRWQWQPARPSLRQTVVVVAAVIAVLAVLIAVSSRTIRTDESERPADSSSEDQGAAPATDAGRPAPQAARGPDMFDYVALTAVVLVSMSVVGVAVVTGRARRVTERDAAEEFATTSVPTDRDPTGVSETLARAAELGLAEMAEPGRDPREAIIACYAAMEQALADAPDVAPRISDTPSEVLARAVEHGVLHTRAAAELVALFTEARFSPHRMVETDRESAVRHMRAVLDDVRAVRRP